MNDYTYIKLYRRTLKNRVVTKDAHHLAIWVWLLMKACKFPTEVDFGGDVITLKPGQYTTGRKEIAEALSVNESKVYRVLKRFESEHLIEQRTDRQCTLITIVQWDKYQEDEQPTEQQVNNERTTNEQRVNTNKESKERKKVNNIVQETEKEFDLLWNMYPKKSGRKDALRHYKAAKKQGVTFAEVRDGIIAYKNYIEKTGTEKQFIKMGSTFFCQRSWEDDYEVPARKPKPSVPAQPEPPKYREFKPEPKRETVEMPDEIRKKLREIF